MKDIGQTGVRDPDSPCDGYKYLDRSKSSSYGDCNTDGHYLCEECVYISIKAFRRFHDMCEECGGVIYEVYGRHLCGVCDRDSPEFEKKMNEIMDE